MGTYGTVIYLTGLRTVLIALALVSLASAQPLIRVSTRLVDISVIARDSKGRVPALTKDDFKVFDNGVERPIAFFAVHSARSQETGAPPPAPNVFTNRAEERDAATRLTVFVIDALNTEFGTQARVRQQFLKRVRQLSPHDRAAVWVMNDRIRRIQDFTADPEQLVAAMERASPKVWLTPEIDSAIARRSPANEGEALADSSARTAEEMMQYYRMQLTNDMLKNLGEELARIPGRKNVVWLSAAFPVNMSIGPGGPETSFVTGRLTGTGRALARADIALYPVDVRGVVAPEGGQSVAALATAERNRHESMKVIAAATGGRAILNGNDIGAAIREVMDDAEVTYSVGFYPADNVPDGVYHRVRIEVKQPGVSLRYRDGFVSTPAPEATRQATIQNALQSPLHEGGIGISVRLDPEDPKRPGWLNMSVGIDPSGVTGDFDLIIQQHAADGRDLALVGEVARLKDGQPLYRRVKLAPNAARIRIVAYDRTSGRTGSVDLPAKTRAAAPPAK